MTFLTVRGVFNACAWDATPACGSHLCRLQTVTSVMTLETFSNAYSRCKNTVE